MLNTLAWCKGEKNPHIWCQKCREYGSNVRVKCRHKRGVFFLYGVLGWEIKWWRVRLHGRVIRGSMIALQSGMSWEKPSLKHNKGNGKSRKQRQRKTGQHILRVRWMRKGKHFRVLSTILCLGNWYSVLLLKVIYWSIHPSSIHWHYYFGILNLLKRDSQPYKKGIHFLKPFSLLSPVMCLTLSYDNTVSTLKKWGRK